MFPHPHTVCTLKAMDHQALLAEAEQARRAALIGPAAAPGPSLAAAARGRWAALHAAMRGRLRGIGPATPSAPRAAR